MAASATPAGGSTSPVMPMTRREFLYYVWAASMAMFMAQMGGAVMWFAYPRFKAGEFGGVFTLDVGEVPAPDSGPKSFDAGRFWLVNLGDKDVTDERLPADYPQQKGVKALYKICVHLGCLYKWVPTTTIALRTQQVLAFETGVGDTVDPLAGSYYIEALTDELESRAAALIRRIDEVGGAVAAIEQGFQQREIADSAYRFQQSVEGGDAVVVGVNRFAQEEDERLPILRVADELGRRQIERTAQVRAGRDNTRCTAALDESKDARGAERT